jgi:hypothetical protein
MDIIMIIITNAWSSLEGVCHNVALPFTLKGIFRQKENYENSNISPCKKYELQKIL